MKDKYTHLKEVALKNNCPECYSNEGLHINFKQKIIENKFYKSITPDVTHELICKTCNSTIYPVSWTDDIEQVFDYHQKAITPMKPSTFVKKASWIAVAIIVVIVALALFLVYYTENL